MIDHVGNLTERFRKALMREHHDDWTMEVISEASHICAQTLIGNEGPTKLVPGDTLEKAIQRYENGGFGPYGSPSADKRFQQYMGLLAEVKP